MKKQIIRIRCEGARRVKPEEFIAFQGDLKTPVDDGQKIQRSLKDDGFTFPVFFWENNGLKYTIDGHFRIAALKALLRQGWELEGDGTIPADPIHADNEKQARERVLMASSHFARITRTGVLDYLKESDIDLSDLRGRVNFLELNIDKISTSDLQSASDTPPEAPSKTRTKRGDLYELGNHRLLCGDATSNEDHARLMDGLKAALVHTDPPYGVDYQGKGGMAGDDKKAIDHLTKLLTPAYKLLGRNTTAEAAFYIWHASARETIHKASMLAAGLFEIQPIIWVKPSLTLGWAHYHWAYEPCSYAAKQGASPKFYAGRAESNVWRIGFKSEAEQSHILGPGLLISHGDGAQLFITSAAPKAKKYGTGIVLGPGQMVYINEVGATTDVWEISRESRTEHPTQKPLELCRRAIENSSLADQIVLDTFGGSGSTLIAAEQTGRHCFMMELDPKWCDVIVSRWAKETGQEAVTKNGKKLKW